VRRVATSRRSLLRFPTTVEEAAAEQQRLRPRLVLEPPPGFAPRTVGGFDVSMTRGSDVGYAGIAVLDLATRATVATATAVAALPMPYVPGYLSFRELPVLVGAWEALTAQGVRPDVLIFDGQGYAHPRRFGVACHGACCSTCPPSDAPSRSSSGATSRSAPSAAPAPRSSTDARWWGWRSGCAPTSTR
jgi:hypothetical protein